MDQIELTLAAKFALVTQTKLIEGCDDPAALRKLAIQLLEANAAMKALLLHHMKEAMQAPFKVHPGAPAPPVLAPKPVRKRTPSDVPQKWHLVHDERGAHYRWGIRQELIDLGLKLDQE